MLHVEIDFGPGTILIGDREAVALGTVRQDLVVSSGIKCSSSCCLLGNGISIVSSSIS